MRRDARGFRVYTEFKDCVGAEVTIKMSSNVQKRGWIFTKGGLAGPNEGSISFNNVQAKRMITALQNFLKDS